MWRTPALALLLAACGPSEPACERAIGGATEEASAPDRRLLGLAAAYPADPSLEGRLEELTASQRARRAVAWAAVARVLAPAPLTEPTPLGEASVPRWRTFYDREDFGRIFQHLYAGLTPAERAARARFPAGRVDDAFAANVGFLDALGTWPQARWDDYLASLDTPEAVSALGGIHRIAMSPSMTRHLAESYPEVLRCLEDGAPPAELAGVSRTDRLLRAPIALEACGEARFGPFFVPRGASLEAALAGAGARVVMTEGPAGSSICDDATRCVASGPSQISLSVRADEGPASVVLEVSRTETVPPVACLAGALPLDAVSIAAEWRRLDPARPLPTYDTSADGLARALEDEAPTWGEGDGAAQPGPEAIHTLTLRDGATFVLAGLHIRTRELPLGLAITLWWSDRPDEDFGADRPESIRALGGPWSSYKMCVAVDHEELDPDPQGGFADDAPSLGAALAAAYEGRGGPTWCSNPYIDAAPGLARGNCVGCHQHAMGGARPGEIATDPVRFPSNGRLAARNNYPADGCWGLDAGDDLAATMQDVVDYWSSP
ncbi:MAG: hypothetical protein KF729_01325 [Sandaracinaceae bacterium]|nr:hypothetical protein [Sandaracinaceae bacterium]